MSKVAIKVENLGKQYRLGDVGTGTISHDLNRWWHKIRGKEDPFLKIGEENDRSKKGNSDLVWSLKDINFEVEQGEILGIIGKNGAGKSTLLKILSRVTTPTVGQFKARGRIASLLEVGTGFHPELTGKANIFLNGAILGMTKAEIKSKFDEIVDFSGVERYIDTPVKRYSSGMYVRLAFAVAAHLEPEILIVDEVLAVGDAEFQKKSLGKIKDVSGQGRTVLFVSHNMTAIKLICNKCMFLRNGRFVNKGDCEEIISDYLKDESIRDFNYTENIPEHLHTISTGEGKFVRIGLFNFQNRFVDTISFLSKFTVKLEIEIATPLDSVAISVFVLNKFGDRVLMANPKNYNPLRFSIGLYVLEVEFNTYLMPGAYSFSISMAHFLSGNTISLIENIYPFNVSKESHESNVEYPWNTVHGYIVPSTVWKIYKK